MISVVDVAGSREISKPSYHFQQSGSGIGGISAQVVCALSLTYQYGFIVVSLKASLHKFF